MKVFGSSRLKYVLQLQLGFRRLRFEGFAGIQEAPDLKVYY